MSIRDFPSMWMLSFLSREWGSCFCFFFKNLSNLDARSRPLFYEVKRSIEQLVFNDNLLDSAMVLIGKNVRFRSPMLTYGCDEILTDVQIFEIL